MKKNYRQIIVGGCALLLSVAGMGQESTPDRVTVPLHDASRPAQVKANLMNGGITVKGYDGKDVVVEAGIRARGSNEEEKPDKKAGGLKRINVATTGLTVEEEDNVVSISTSSMYRGVDLAIQVPSKCSLKLSCMNEGEIRVEKVDGEIEASNLNGGVTLTNVSGIVVAHSLNGEININLERVTPEKPMSFSTLNGDIDVTFPSDTKATVKMETQNGSIYSDFDIQLSADPRQPTVEDGRKGGGKFRVVIEKARFGTINGGGPDFQFKTFNGNIHIRKGKP